MGRRFAHQCFPDSSESIRANRFAKDTYFLSTWPAFARIASSLRFALRFVRFASNSRCYPIFWKVDSQQKKIEARIDSRESAHKVPESWEHFVHSKSLGICIQDLHFLLQAPRTLEQILKPREVQHIIDLDTFLKGFRRVLEGVLKGF